MSRDYAKKTRRSSTTSGGATRSGTGRMGSNKKQTGRGMSKRPAQARNSTRQTAAPKMARPKGQSGRLSVRWVLSLALIGGFAGFIVYLNSLPVPNSDQDRTVSAPANSKIPKIAPETQRQKEDGFQFYDMLPDSEVVPPKVEEYDPGPTADERDFRYVVQTGSFRGQQDAERQRAQIAFQGLRANVQKITLDSGTVWYRVNVGPFSSRSKMNSAIDKLVGISIQPLVRKVPKESTKQG